MGKVVINYIVQTWRYQTSPFCIQIEKLAMQPFFLEINGPRSVAIPTASSFLHESTPTRGFETYDFDCMML